MLVRELKQVWEHANERGADGLAGTTYDDVFDPSACTCAAASSAAGVSGAQRFLQRECDADHDRLPSQRPYLFGLPVLA